MNVNQTKISKKNIILIWIAVLLILCVIAGAVVFEVNRINKGNQIYRISVSEFPKTEYFVGENADFSNLKLEVLLNNGKTYFVESSECEISGFNSGSVQEKQRISVEYNGYFCYFNVNIIAKPTPKPILVSISLESMPKTNYVLGEWLDTTGGVILLTYSDESIKRVNLKNSHVYGFENCTEAGVYTLTVKYSDGIVVRETTYQITVSAN